MDRTFLQVYHRHCEMGRFGITYPAILCSNDIDGIPRVLLIIRILDIILGIQLQILDTALLNPVPL